MNRSHLEHLIRASADIADDEEIVIVGSQAVLGQFPEAPPELLVSMEADLYPLHHPERGDVIDGSIGEGSPFHDAFGYYAQGVAPSTAILPDGWRERLIPIRNARTRGATGWCLEIHDLVLSKLVAGRDKDLGFARAALKHHLARPEILCERARSLPVSDEVRRIVLDRVRGASEASRPTGSRG
jgi:uncharacterized nucleotidyltransferase DUF6036